MTRFTYGTPLLLGALALTACPGDDVPADTEGTTSGVDSTDATSVGPGTTPLTTTVDPDSGSGTTTLDETTTGDDPCADVDCPEGEQCVGGTCFECSDPTCDGGCGAGETCQCPEDDLCCDVGSCAPPVCPLPSVGGNYAECLDAMGLPSDAPCNGGVCATGNASSAVCLISGCEEACQCPAAPATGDAEVVCDDVTQDMVDDCWLDCGGGATCPDDMVCFGGFICLFSDTAPVEVPLYGDCVNVSGASCADGGVCLTAPSGGVCSASCANVGECQPGPVTGNAGISCSDVTGDMMPECWLDCSAGQTCADGMECFGGFVCIWPNAPDPVPGYGACALPGSGCPTGEVCLDDPAWEVCSQGGCAVAADCDFVPPATGTAPVACGDPEAMGGANTCYLDCSAGQTCPDGMACIGSSLCAWPQGVELFADDFESGNLSAGWTLANVDGLVPNAAVAFVNDAWVVDSTVDGGNFAAVSTSWYMPAGVSNDWLISPQIMAGANTRLYWVSRSVDAAFPDDLEVRISTATAAVADFEANPALLVVAPEAAGYTFHYIDLAPAGYANQPIYLAFRNTTNDGTLLMVDNVSVVNLP